ncbi:hypothetical protein [Nocardia alni]|uniref:hypothetical protein n=1 Tax=Nocardia alni TaxID=2815723 RepID=UPI001C22309B|nr:hypothetical protein [Nocardia alni]
MSEFRVREIFRISVLPNPYVAGQATGNFTIGQEVELRKEDGMKYRGRLEALDFHHHSDDEIALMFSTELSAQIEPGDVIYSVSEEEPPR